ncbi:MAG: ABC transporter ATP-binding protein [bacterium]|nr:ABC transporter ATP-binding protein [bacterium]
MLEVRGLSKQFGSFTAVSDLSLEVRRGEIFAFLGPNGAGQTTTIRMVMGILAPTAGAAFIAGRDCFAERAEVMRHVGYLPDDPAFYDYLRGREIIQFVGEMHGIPMAAINRRSRDMVKRFQLGEAMDEFAANYSRGMKKKLGMVCAMLHNPDLLILDEPTNGLDPMSSRTLHEVIREMAAAGKSIFFSTHLLDQAERLCNRVAILYKGKKAAAGTPEYLSRNLAEGGSLEEIFFAVASDEAGET